MQEKMVIYYLECNIYFILLYINFSKYMIFINVKQYLSIITIAALWQRISNSIKQYLKKTNSTELRLYFIFNIFVSSFINICLTLEYRIYSLIDIAFENTHLHIAISKFKPRIKPREKLKKICIYINIKRICV